jgi:hypothetical protein
MQNAGATHLRLGIRGLSITGYPKFGQVYPYGLGKAHNSGLGSNEVMDPSQMDHKGLQMIS